MNEKFDGLVQHLLSGGIFLEQAVEVLEMAMIDGALKASGGNQSAASKRLGIHRNTLQRKMVEYALGNGRPRRKPAARATLVRKRKKKTA